MSANSHFINMGNCPSILIGGLAGSVQVEDSSKSYKGDLRPYPSSLEYLDDAFQVLALKLRMAKARHKEALKEAIDDRPWYGVRSSKVTSSIIGILQNDAIFPGGTSFVHGTSLWETSSQNLVIHVVSLKTLHCTKL